MASKTEAGHGKNNAKFGQIIAICTNMGTDYNPINANIQVSNMQTRRDMVTTTITNLQDRLNDLNEFTNQRAIVYKELTALLPRILSNIKLTKPSAATLDDTAGYIAKLRGTRRGKLPEAPATLDASTGEPAKKQISVAQLSFDMRLENFEKLVIQVRNMVNYGSNEPDLTVTALQQRHIDMKNLNNAVVNADRIVAELRLLRDSLLYNEHTGVLDTVQEVKNYLRTLKEGTQNKQYRAATKIQLRSTEE